MATEVILEGGPFDGVRVLVPAGAHAVWVETLSPTLRTPVSEYADETPGYVARFIKVMPPLRVDECSRFVQYRRRANPRGEPVFFAPPEGHDWAEMVKTSYYAKPIE